MLLGTCCPVLASSHHLTFGQLLLKSDLSQVAFCHQSVSHTRHLSCDKYPQPFPCNPLTPPVLQTLLLLHEALFLYYSVCSNNAILKLSVNNTYRMALLFVMPTCQPFLKYLWSAISKPAFDQLLLHVVEQLFSHISSITLNFFKCIHWSCVDKALNLLIRSQNHRMVILKFPEEEQSQSY